jgi:hypothetical protein
MSLLNILNIITSKVNLIPGGGLIMPIPYLKSCPPLSAHRLLPLVLPPQVHFPESRPTKSFRPPEIIQLQNPSGAENLHPLLGKTCMPVCQMREKTGHWSSGILSALKADSGISMVNCDMESTLLKSYQFNICLIYNPNIS